MGSIQQLFKDVEIFSFLGSCVAFPFFPPPGSNTQICNNSQCKQENNNIHVNIDAGDVVKETGNLLQGIHQTLTKGQHNGHHGHGRPVQGHHQGGTQGQGNTQFCQNGQCSQTNNGIGRPQGPQCRDRHCQPQQPQGNGQFCSGSHCLQQNSGGGNLQGCAGSQCLQHNSAGGNQQSCQGAQCHQQNGQFQSQHHPHQHQRGQALQFCSTFPFCK